MSSTNTLVVDSVQPGLAACLVLLLEIFDSIDTTKPAILSGAREPGEWGDDG